jgi:hypothetical protein
MVDVYAATDRIVAIGIRYSDDTLEIPVAWVSDDGLNWREADPIDAARATTPRAVSRTAAGTFVMLTTVTSFPTGCSDVSCLTQSLEAWHSTDGRKWQKAESPLASAAFGSYRRIQLLPVSGGLVAIVSAGDTSAAWVTADGATWKDAEFISPNVYVSAGASNGESVRLFSPSGVVVTGQTP